MPRIRVFKVEKEKQTLPRIRCFKLEKEKKTCLELDFSNLKKKKKTFPRIKLFKLEKEKKTLLRITFFKLERGKKPLFFFFNYNKTLPVIRLLHTFLAKFAKVDNSFVPALENETCVFLFGKKAANHFNVSCCGILPAQKENGGRKFSK